MQQNPVLKKLKMDWCRYKIVWIYLRISNLWNNFSARQALHHQKALNLKTWTGYVFKPLIFNKANLVSAAHRKSGQINWLLKNAGFHSIPTLLKFMINQVNSQLHFISKLPFSLNISEIMLHRTHSHNSV